NEFKLGEAVTDNAGNYTITIPPNAVPTPGTFFTLVIRAESRTDKFEIESPGIPGTIYSFEQVFTNVVDQASIAAKLPNNINFDKLSLSDTDIEKQRVWAVYSCVFLARRFVDASAELNTAGFLEINFPNILDRGSEVISMAIPMTTMATVIDMNIAVNDYADFDVILHEFSHYLAKQFDMDDNFGGTHDATQDLIRQRGDKKIGIGLAWAEGIANAFPLIFAAEISHAHGTGLAPRFNNNDFDDFENGLFSDISFPVETNPGVVNPAGTLNSEGSEQTTARIIFDLYDGGSVLEPFDRVNWGAERLFRELKTARVGTLDALWDYLTKDQLIPNLIIPSTSVTFIGQTVSDLYAPLFAGNGVAPLPLTPRGAATEIETPTGRVVRFEFEQNLNSTRNPQMFFSILLVTPDGKVVLSSDSKAADPNPNNDNLTIDFPSPLVELARTNAKGMPLFWTAAGVDQAEPATGVYVGPLVPLEVSAQLFFLIDTTASMQPEIGSVRDGLLAFLKRFDPASTTTTFQLITFKDNVSTNAATKDLSVIQSQVAALSADGGDDVPEASVEALWQVSRQAVGTTGGRPTVFLATDAPPHKFLSIIVTVALLRTAGVRVNTLLTEQDSFFRAQSAISQRGEEGMTGIVQPGPELDISKLVPTETFTSATDAYGQITDGTGGVLLKIDKTDTASLVAATENLTAGGIFPAVVQALPRTAPAGTTLDLLIQGQNTNFDASSTVSFSNTAITVNSVSVRSPIELSANITIGTGALTGPSDVTVKTANESALGVRVFTVNEATSTPLILSVSPIRGERGSTLTVTILGVNTSFASTSAVSFGNEGITVKAVNALSLTTLQATIEIAPDAAVEFRDVTVDGLFQRNAFRVASALPAFPLIKSITPSAITPGETLDLVLTGENTAFTAESTASFSGSGLTVNSVTLVSPTELRVNVTATLDAPPTFRDVFVTTAGNVVAGLQLLKVINTAPVVDPLDIDGDGIPNDFDSDMDGDGVPNAIETQLGFDQADPASAPAPAITVSVPIRKISLKISYSKPGRDSFSFSGTLPLATGTPLTGRTLVFDIGGINATVVSGSSQFKLSKPRNGESRYTVKFVKQDLAAGLTAAGFGPNQNFPLDLPVSLAFEGLYLQQNLVAGFKSNAKTGTLR
ncbi:MAG TPA: vWA domain-containing protein, partial [Planctomycetota bacterium]|nr:vWA domain-containing protein [Planctomycetota bacterium]